MTVIQVVSSTMIDCSFACGLIWELKDLLYCNFISRVLMFNSRSCNLVVHGVAALGTSLSPELLSIRDSFPTCI